MTLSLSPLQSDWIRMGVCMTQFYLHGEVVGGWRLPSMSSWVLAHPPSNNGGSRQCSKISKTLGASRMPTEIL